MAAPQHNEFYKLRLKDGREPKYTPLKLQEIAIKYFNWVKRTPFYETKAFHFKGIVTKTKLPVQRPYTILGFCNFAGITQKTYENYCKKKGFLRVTTAIDEIVRNNKFEGAAANIFNSNIIARDLGLIDKQESTENVQLGVNLTPQKIKEINDILENEC